MIKRQTTKDLIAESPKELFTHITADKITVKEIAQNCGITPEGVVITQKSCEIVAVNKAAEKFGLTAGIKCSSIGKPSDHKGCR